MSREGTKKQSNAQKLLRNFVSSRDIWIRHSDFVIDSQFGFRISEFERSSVVIDFCNHNIGCQLKMQRVGRSGIVLIRSETTAVQSIRRLFP
jgi:hypothetical protein